MIKNKKLFMASMILFVISMAMNFPFPNEYPLGDEGTAVFTIPINSAEGIYYKGVFNLILLILGIVFLHRSLEKYHLRSFFAVIIIFSLLPPYLAETYQKTLANGINAVSYIKDESRCTFEMTGKDTLKGICQLPFENYSNDEVSFTIGFYDKYLFEEDVKMVSLMSSGEPHSVNLHPNESKLVRIEKEMDVSQIPNHVTNGESAYISIMIKSGEKIRKL
ncbi:MULTISPECIES: hypothetical protein [unclassified Cytobacillus]|uniref:hypothetical protein n=1 Tax=unclassified Cytobacillus TaxID=2675268 RepID=UPI0013581754|nr:hypothetical protein [Cytobacillus sp. AMY 15.2]KAF0819937.1 putative lipoprotein [Bacillus sp. ZZV12-4809]MCM3093209.1 hypothetical protein [Cytobacillus sp. AMY 15.2]